MPKVLVFQEEFCFLKSAFSIGGFRSIPVRDIADDLIIIPSQSAFLFYFVHQNNYLSDFRVRFLILLPKGTPTIMCYSFSLITCQYIGYCIWMLVVTIWTISTPLFQNNIV